MNMKTKSHLPLWIVAVSIGILTGNITSCTTGLESDEKPTVCPPGSISHITKVFEYVPAVGQFTNTMPEYEEGDTQETMNQKVLEAIGNNPKDNSLTMVSLGGYGGYITVGFDHTIENKPGLCDFRVLGNVFYSTGGSQANDATGGGCEPGIIMVAADKNGNGRPDEDEWYEIAGSAHRHPTKEAWYDAAQKAGNDVNLYTAYEITYYRPEKEPSTPEEKKQYIRWEDNKGHSGYKMKNDYHSQPYFPQWIESDKLTFKGTCLPQNGIDKSGTGTYFVLYQFRYGYADNAMNTEATSTIDIDWAVDAQGNPVHLPGIDFIKVYTGVNQENGWIGECSTEITGIEDLHLSGQQIASEY